MKIKIKNILLYIMTLIFIIFIFPNISFAKSQTLNDLNFDVELDSAGNMHVVETWDILIEDTNTVFKTFDLDTEKFENVSVKEITNGNYQEYKNVNQYQYHVDKHGFYALENNEGDFEIAWNVGADGRSIKKKYEISYTVKNIVNVYNDCAELYWQFISTQSSIPVRKLTGVIKLPKAVSPMEEFRVWAHGPLTGEIIREAADIAKFSVSDLNSNTMVEVRIITPTDIFEQSTNNEDTNKLELIMSEEAKWAEDANQQRENAKRIMKLSKNRNTIMVLVITIIGVFALFKANEVLKTYPKMKPEQELTYCRNFPDENATPGDVEFLYDFRKKYDTGKVISATFLNLSLKKFVEFESIPNDNKNVNIIIKNEEEEALLPEDEKKIFRFLKIAAGLKRKISMKEFRRYCEKNDTESFNLWNEIPKISKRNNFNKGNYDIKIAKRGRKYTSLIIVWIIIAIFSLLLLVETKIAIIAITISFMNAVICILAGDRLKGLTQKGINEKEKWEGIKRFMTDFSLLDEKRIPDLILWEKYLVYATVFGVAKDVLKQLKVRFPELQDDEYLRNNYSFIYYCDHYNVSTNFERAIQSGYSAKVAEIASSTMSSVSGSGGGFSSGGGGGFGGGSMGGR